jgi:hypothetical protein
MASKVVLSLAFFGGCGQFSVWALILRKGPLLIKGTAAAIRDTEVAVLCNFLGGSRRSEASGLIFLGLAVFVFVAVDSSTLADYTRDFIPWYSVNTA